MMYVVAVLDLLQLWRGRFSSPDPGMLSTDMPQKIAAYLLWK